MDLTITSEPARNGVTRLRVTGAIDIAARDEVFRVGVAALQDACAARDESTSAGASVPALRLNLHGVHFMDSTGIGLLVELARESRERGAAFAIEEPSRRVLQILTLTGLRDEWAVSDGLDEAVEPLES